MTVLASISEAEFMAFDPCWRVIVHDHPRRFGALKLPRASHPLALSWRSDQVEPVVVDDPISSAVWIGVDQRVVCLSPEGIILFSIGLGGQLAQIKPFDAFVALLCETVLIAVNRTYSIRSIADLKEIPDSVFMEDGVLTGTLIDGDKMT